MAVRTAYDPTAGEVLTATNLEKLAGGWIGYAEVTANQSGITGVVDLTSLSLAVTAGPGRRLMITGQIEASSTVGSDQIKIGINEGATILQQVDFTPGSTAFNTIRGSVVITPTTGAHTYKLTLQRAAGTGSITMGSGATNPAFILVEDIGPAA